MLQKTSQQPQISNERLKWESISPTFLRTTYQRHFVKEDDVKDKKVLEIGCGDLFYAAYVNCSKLYKSYTGLDISMRALAEAKADWGKEHSLRQMRLNCPSRINPLIP